MLTVSDVSLRCLGRNTFARGELIYQVKNVKEFSTETLPDGHKILVHAKVKGNNVTDYDTRAVVDEVSSSVENVYCNCPGYNEYAGLCKHCAAMLLEYIARRDGHEIQNFSLVRRDTDIGFRAILEKFSMSKRVGFLQPEVAGRIRMIPSLVEEGKTLKAEFRIGIHHFYQIKNIPQFVQEIKSMELVKYGKNLEFYNTIYAYTEASKEMIRFIISCSEEDGVRGKQDKYLVLKASVLDEFMKLLEKEPVSLTREGYEIGKVSIVEGTPKDVLQIEGVEGGVFIRTEKQCIWHGRNYAYLPYRDKIYRMKLDDCAYLEEFIRYSNAYAKQGIFLSDRELPLFVRDMLPELRQVYHVKTEKFDEGKYKSRKVMFEFYLDAPELNLITCKALAVYHPEEKFNIFDKSLPEHDRDLLQESMIAAKIQNMTDAFDPETCCPVISSEDNIYEFLTQGIEILRKFGEVFVSDEMKKLEVKAAPRVELGISLKGDLLELTLENGELPLDKLAEILSRYDRKKKYYRLKTGEFLRMEHEELAVLADMGKHLHFSRKELAQGKIRISRYHSFYLDAGMKQFGEITYHYDRAFQKLLDEWKHISQEELDMPGDFNQTLREYQKQGVIWMKKLKTLGFGAVLADEMGLGKTLQVIALLAWNKRERLEGQPVYPTLVVCPASLIYNWKSELERFAPELTIRMVSGTSAHRREILLGEEKQDVWITSYDLLKRDILFYENQFFEFEIIDEAQYIKNHNTQVSKAVKQVRADYKIALTGTPVENRLSELWSIFDYVMPGFLYSYRQFREEIESPIVTQSDDEKMEYLQKVIAPFVLRRRKKDVLQFLPDKLEKNMYVQMEEEQRELYLAHVQRMKMLLEGESEEQFHKSKIQIFSELTRLRQICCNPELVYEKYHGGSAKTTMCMELIRDAVEGGHKVLLFSQFTSMLDLLLKALRKEGIDYLTLTGSVSKENRIKLVQEFNRGEVPVFCISLKAGGTGLNLTAADIVIHYDPWWNVAVQDQATDRAHRIGQKNVVTVYKLIARDTIEEKIVELQDKKRELAEQILGNSGLRSVEITREQILELLQ